MLRAVFLIFGVLLPVISRAQTTRGPVPVCGCALPPAQAFVLFFKPGQTHLDAKSRKLVGMAAHAALTNNKSFVEIEGDAAPDHSLNTSMLISIRRADRVANLLRTDGVPQSQFTVTALGSTQPLRDEEHQPAAALEERRVVVWVYPDRDSLNKS